MKNGLALLARFVPVIAFAAAAAAADFPLARGPFRDLQLVPARDGIVELELLSGDPHFWTAPAGPECDPAKNQVLAFEYFCPAGITAFAVRFRGREGMVLAGSSPLPLAEAWRPFAMDLSGAPVAPDAAVPDFRFHFSLCGKPGTRIQIRGLRLHEALDSERLAREEREKRAAEKAADAAACLDYLRAKYPASIDTVHLGLNVITLTGSCDRKAWLAGFDPSIPSHLTSADNGVRMAEVEPGAGGQFRVSLPRTGENGIDRALWRWRLIGADGGLLTACRWPTVEGPAAARRELKKLTAPHQKGLGGVPHLGNDDHEIFSLGIAHATVNLVINSFLFDSPRPGTRPWDFEGRTWHLREAALKTQDDTIRRLSARGVIVSCILLVGNHRDAAGNPLSLLTHPEAEARGIFSMPNLATPEGTACYRAAIHHLAERYTRTGGEHGRVSNWILHNEIDQAGTWTNMGDQPLARYLETYLRSARIVHHGARVFDPHARVFLSLTHHWTRKSGGAGTYVVRDLVDLFAEMARTEGDFDWGVAYHPYPHDLRNPDTWADGGATDDFDTPYITPKNIPVLVRYFSRPSLLYQGRPRGILLSEQGFNTPTLGLEDQRRQAAAMIYTFRKLRQLPGIEAFHLHRYQDMPEAEGGLRLGIVDEKGNRKLGWEVYRDIGTEREEKWAGLAEGVK